MLLPRKPVEWVGSSRKDMQGMPNAVKRTFGIALDEAQQGRKHHSAKPLHGFSGASILEIVENFSSDTYRAIYTVRFEEAIYVLHVFQKKSRQEIQTARPDVDLIRSRLQQAEVIHSEYVRQQER